MRGLDMTEVYPGLYQGSRPPIGPTLRRAGVDTLVLSAVEYQPAAEMFPGVDVLSVPLDDSFEPTAHERHAARQVAREVARLIEAGHRVLVTCYLGHNRSGWIVGHALVDLGVPPARAVEMVRTKRPGALNNRVFAADVLARRDERFVRRSE